MGALWIHAGGDDLRNQWSVGGEKKKWRIRGGSQTGEVDKIDGGWTGEKRKLRMEGGSNAGTTTRLRKKTKRHPQTKKKVIGMLR